MPELRYYLLYVMTEYLICFESDWEQATFRVKEFSTAQEAFDYFSDQYPGTTLNVEIKPDAQASR